ncbi:enolase C-terminal domain-like protein [Streptomyces fenghuangensis]|uniref:enolase C-terminal domain-like protein n=1 Tax=Streptomyces sp. ICN903 TaxID=2964654 RepID=UPI0035AEDC47
MTRRRRPGSPSAPLPLIADEDATGYDDALRLAGRVRGVNVKLAKCGGVHQALRVIDALDGSGTDVMLGCPTASSLGTAPAVHLADRARWADLDGHLLLAHDPWQGIGGADGTVRATGCPDSVSPPAPAPTPRRSPLPGSSRCSPSPGHSSRPPARWGGPAAPESSATGGRC